MKGSICLCENLFVALSGSDLLLTYVAGILIPTTKRDHQVEDLKIPLCQTIYSICIIAPFEVGRKRGTSVSFLNIDYVVKQV